MEIWFKTVSKVTPNSIVLIPSLMAAGLNLPPCLTSLLSAACALSLLLYSPATPLSSSASFLTFASPSFPSSFVLTATASTTVTPSPALRLFSFFLFSLPPSLSSGVVVLCHRTPSMSPPSQDLDLLHLPSYHILPFSRFPWFHLHIAALRPFFLVDASVHRRCHRGGSMVSPKNRPPPSCFLSPLPSTSSTSTTVADLLSPPAGIHSAAASLLPLFFSALSPPSIAAGYTASFLPSLSSTRSRSSLPPPPGFLCSPSTFLFSLPSPLPTTVAVAAFLLTSMISPSSSVAVRRRRHRCYLPPFALPPPWPPSSIWRKRMAL